MDTPPTLSVISLGEGAQPFVKALMSGEGAFDRVPDSVVLYGRTLSRMPSSERKPA